MVASTTIRLTDELQNLEWALEDLLSQIEGVRGEFHTLIDQIDQDEELNYESWARNYRHRIEELNNIATELSYDTDMIVSFVPQEEENGGEA